MFIERFVNDIYFEEIINNYDESFLNSIDEENFIEIYKLLKQANCYFIEDVILKYLEIFTMDLKSVNDSLMKLREKYGNDYMSYIGKNMTILKEIVNN